MLGVIGFFWSRTVFQYFHCGCGLSCRSTAGSRRYRSGRRSRRHRGAFICFNLQLFVQHGARVVPHICSKVSNIMAPLDYKTPLLVIWNFKYIDALTKCCKLFGMYCLLLFSVTLSNKVLL